ncbi:hypothetical protein BCR35DRAFT_304534 [Leucosporidium creatinivorum]|uniref:Uncharacterized protein n=1 Tax=Leucosporidium creatinivorum TaxID=106004 RepID=A0A1Y2FA11_9BASI|nr:hypothetical protein BCR35DRAFT_304534 [Leucosporidium creatinivorum]
MACLRVNTERDDKHPVIVRETKHYHQDKVTVVEGELEAKPGQLFSVVFADWRLQHDSSTFTTIKVGGKPAGYIKMDRDSKPLNREPDHDREWKVSEFKDGEPFSFGPTAQGQVIVELHTVRAETGVNPSPFYRSLYRDPEHPEIQFLFPTSRPYATFIFNYHPPENVPRRANVSDSEHSEHSDDNDGKDVDADKKRKLRPNRKKAIVESSEDEYAGENKKKKGKGKKKRDSKSPSFEPEDAEMEEGEIREEEEEGEETPVKVEKKGKGKAREEEEEEEEPTTDEAPKRLRRGKKVVAVEEQVESDADVSADEEGEDDFTPTKVAAKKKSKSKAAKVAVKPPPAATKGGRGKGKGKKKISKATISSEDEEDDSGLGPVPQPMSEDEV